MIRGYPVLKKNKKPFPGIGKGLHNSFMPGFVRSYQVIYVTTLVCLEAQPVGQVIIQSKGHGLLCSGTSFNALLLNPVFLFHAL